MTAAPRKIPLVQQVEVIGNLLNQATLKDGSLAGNAVVILTNQQLLDLQTVHQTLTVFSGNEDKIRRAIYGRRE